MQSLLENSTKKKKKNIKPTFFLYFSLYYNKKNKKKLCQSKAKRERKTEIYFLQKIKKIQKICYRINKNKNSMK